jgi:signal transduction histidine kinase
VRELVEAHGGSVAARSPGWGQGSAFTVLLPLTVMKVRPEELKAPP